MSRPTEEGGYEGTGLLPKDELDRAGVRFSSLG